MKKTFNLEMLSILFILVLWGIMVIITNPIGDFPLNDDWAYAKSVRTLLNDHKLILPDWFAPNLVAQVIWGWLFAVVIGPSFTVLRISVLVLGLLGVIFTFKLSREIGASFSVAILMALLLMVNPVYFTSSNTFMTDVPFFTFSAIALLFFTRVIYQDKTSDIILGTVAIGVALLIRQLAYAIVIAYALAYMVGHRLSIRVILRALIPLIISILIQLLFRIWLNITNQLPAMHGYQIAQIKEVFSLPILDILRIFGGNLFCIFLNLGLFLMPLSLLIFFYLKEKLTMISVVFIVLLTILSYEILLIAGMPLFPLLGNIVSVRGIGPMLSLHGVTDILPKHITLAVIFWSFIGLLSVWSTGLMVYLLYTSLYRMSVNRSKIIKIWFCEQVEDITRVRLYILFLATTLIYCIPTLFLPHVFDRYLLLPMLTLSLLMQLIIPVTSKLTRLRVGIVVFLVTIAGILTTVAVHDYLAWNRARWAALNDLVYRQGISPARIDGGFEFNGMYLFSKNEIKPNSKGWWVIDNEYLISYTTNYKRYIVEARYPVNVYLPFSPRNIFVLHRK